MLRMQTVFAECPGKSKLNYQLRISLFDWTPDEYQVMIQQPDSEATECQVIDESINIERTDGPGVWRFNAVVRSKNNPQDITDVLTVESVIFPEVHNLAKTAVESCIGSMNLAITGDGSTMQGNSDVTADALKLYSEFGDSSSLEILRRLAMNRQNQNDTIRCIYLLECNLNRSSAKWLLPFALPVLCEVACSTSKTFTTGSVHRLIKSILLSPNEKWIYLMRLALESTAQGYGLANIISELGRCTPSEYRNQTAEMIIELCKGRGQFQREAANLCLSFEYAACAPDILDWVQTNNCDFGIACKIFQMADYKEAIPLLQKQIKKPGNNQNDDEIVALLAQWYDTDSIPWMFVKIETGEDYQAERMATHLAASFGSKIQEQMKDIQSHCSPEKAKRIGQVLSKITK